MYKYLILAFFVMIVGCAKPLGVSGAIPYVKDSSLEKVSIPIELSQLVMIYRPELNLFYPAESKKKGEQGVVGIQVYIDESGAVTSVSIVQSSDYSRLDNAAIQLASRTRFKPYFINGTPSKTNSAFKIRFALNNDEEDSSSVGKK
jgi:protein TonB